MRVSVVIPYFNSAETLGTQLAALATQNLSDSWEVVISDNESSDDLARIVRAHSARLPDLLVVDASDRRGAAHARNVGIEASHGEVLALCDADDEVAPGWLAAMTRALTSHDFVACRLDLMKLNPPSVRQVFKGHSQQWGLQRAPYPPHLFHAGGGTLGFKRSVFESVGGFDESWQVLEDTDFCFRAQLAGNELHFVHDAVIHLRCRRDLSGLFKQADSYAEHRARLYRKYRPPGARAVNAWRQHITRWDRLLRNISELKSHETRAKWVWRLGWQVGQLQGSVRYFVAPV